MITQEDSRRTKRTTTARRRAMLLSAAIGALALVGTASAAASKPHIIYVIGDDVGWHRMVRQSSLSSFASRVSSVPHFQHTASTERVLLLRPRAGTTRRPEHPTSISW